MLERYGVSDDDAFAVGLTCGGILDVYVEKVDRQTFPELEEIAADVEAGRPVAVATVIEHPDPAWLGRRMVVRPDEPTPPGRSAATRADDAVHDDALGLLAAGHSATLAYGPDGERRGEGMRVFVWAFAPKPRMLVFGAIDFAAAVARVGSFLGYHVTVCDARPVFATNSRFPDADEVVVDWPHRYLAAEVEAGRIDARTVLAVLTHDPKFDVPLLEVALRLPEVAYIGAMGSRRTHEDRMDRLREAGLTEEELGAALQPDRARPGRADARGDRGLHRRRDHRRALGRHRRAAGGHRRADPPGASRKPLLTRTETGSILDRCGRRPGIDRTRTVAGRYGRKAHAPCDASSRRCEITWDDLGRLPAGHRVGRICTRPKDELMRIPRSLPQYLLPWP